MVRPMNDRETRDHRSHLYSRGPHDQETDMKQVEVHTRNAFEFVYAKPSIIICDEVQ
jgi:hypothetical protein